MLCIFFLFFYYFFFFPSNIIINERNPLEFYDSQTSKLNGIITPKRQAVVWLFYFEGRAGILPVGNNNDYILFLFICPELTAILWPYFF